MHTVNGLWYVVYSYVTETKGEIRYIASTFNGLYCVIALRAEMTQANNAESDSMSWRQYGTNCTSYTFTFPTCPEAEQMFFSHAGIHVVAGAEQVWVIYLLSGNANDTVVLTREWYIIQFISCLLSRVPKAIQSMILLSPKHCNVYIQISISCRLCYYYQLIEI